MNIWIFNHYAIGPNEIGGTRHYDLAKKLSEKGHNITIFASSFNHQKREENQFVLSKKKYIKKKYGDVCFVWIKTFSYKKNNWKRILNILSYSTRAYKYSKNLSETPDIIIGSLVHPLAAFLGYAISRKKRCKFYFEERDLWPQTLVDFGKLSPNNPLTKILYKLELFLYKKSDRIIVLFDKAIEYVVQRGISNEKVIFLPNAVDLDRYRNNSLNLPCEFEKKMQELKGKFLVFYTGSHGVANNLDVLLEIANHLSSNENIHFVLVGDGPEKERLLKLKSSLKLNNATFLPPVPKNLIPTILKYASAGIVTMKDADVYKWGISMNKLFDYMAASLPIFIFSNLTNTPVDISKCGYNINDPLEMARNIEEVYHNESQRNTMGVKGRAFLEKNHSWDGLSNKLIDIMERDLKH